MRGTFKIHPGVGGLIGRANRLQRAATGANNPQIFAWQKERSLMAGGAGEGAGESSNYPIDDFESYVDGFLLNGLNAGLGGWMDPWVGRSNYIGVQCVDEFESYTDGISINGLIGGLHWGVSDAWVGRENYPGVKATEDFESYSDSAALDGLNGGTGWADPWESH